jgi:ABC-2 type transport system ATP-binding protein
MIFELNDPLFLSHYGCELKLTLNPGEVSVLVGENGVGKSTLLHRIFFSLSASKVTLVDQKTLECFFDRKLSTLKKIFLNSSLPNLNQEQFSLLWEKFGLEKKEDRLISVLSGGEAQAVKLCLSLSKESDFYLLDEPLQFLDEEKRNVLIEFLETLRCQGKSLIIVEHNRGLFPSGWQVQELVIQESILKKGNTWTT